MPMKTVDVRIVGACALLMHSPRSINVMEPLVKEMRTITGVRGNKRTDEQMARLYEIEFHLGLYHDPKVGVYIPGDAIESVIRNGARKTRKGKSVEAGVFVDTDRVPLLYKGPRSPEDLWSSGKFTDQRRCGVADASVFRTRPIFREWAAEFKLHFETDHVGIKDLQVFLEEAGASCGLLDYRPKFGRFSVEKFEAVS